MTVPSKSRTVLTSSPAGHSASVRLQYFETNLLSDPVRSPDISRYQNNPLHYYDEDVVRELSLPPDSVSPSATTPSLFPESNGFLAQPQPEGPPSSFLTSPLHHHVSLDQPNHRPRTTTVPATQPSLFAHHGLPASLPPPPRTTFYSTQIPSEPVPEADNIVTYLDSLLRGSYSQMLSKKSESTVPSNSAQEFPQGGESSHLAWHRTAPTDTCPLAPRLRCSSLPRLAGLELSLNDMLRADYLEGNTFEEFLTSPLIQDDSPEETPFLDTPGEDAWTSPMVDAADDSFGFSEMPLFGAAVKRKEESDNVKTPESVDIFQLLQLCPPSESTAPSGVESTKMDSVTPALDPLDTAGMYTFPPTPALAPASLYNSPRRPSTLSLAPSSSTAVTPATTATSKHARPTKPIPTGTRRNITPSALVPLDAPTQPRQYVTPSATSRKVIPAAFTKGKKRARSEVDGGGGDVDQLPEDLDPNTQEAIEIKRRQNTLAARRSRQRKLEHVRELEEAVEHITQDRDMWMARAYDAEEKLRANGLS